MPTGPKSHNFVSETSPLLKIEQDEAHGQDRKLIGFQRFKEGKMKTFNLPKPDRHVLHLNHSIEE